MATYAPIIKKEDGHIDWHKGAVDIGRLVRAFNPWPELSACGKSAAQDLRRGDSKGDPEGKPGRWSGEVQISSR